MKNYTQLINEFKKKSENDKGYIIPILQAIQNEFNYLPDELLHEITAQTTITYSELIGVASFYSQFRFTPSGKHLIKVCVGTACHVKGAMHVYDAFTRHLNLNETEDTDKEKLFTLKQVACLGCCTLAPAVQIDDITYGHVGQKDIPEIINDFLNKSITSEKNIQKHHLKNISDAEIRIGLGSCCVASGSEEVNKALEKAMDTAGINVKVKQVGCVGMCHNVPLLEIEKSGKIIASYAKVKPENIKPILLKHFASSSVFKRIVTSLQNKAEQFYYPDLQSTALKKFLDYREKHVNDFLQKQVHIATEHKGILNPLDIDEYISKEGFAALKNCVTETSREEIITTIIKSGLRGRGGAGFPTGEKWALFSKQQADEKYIICNADEGDPGAFMDRMLLESFPYRIIEGMMIAAYAGGATKGILYVRAEYQLAVLRMKTAIAEMVKKGMINSPLFNSQFIFNLEIFEGAGAFICGEETALIASMEGKRGMPHIRPPYPVQHGLNGKPTLVNNVETFASVPWIIRNGSTIYANIGTTFSKGTKVFALAGKIARGGLIEVPMGITIKEIVEDIGGGISGGKVFKAVQIGGPSGGCIPASLSETTIDYQSLTEAGAMMGSGGLVVLDESDCVIDIAKYFLNFTQAQSCGKCVYCRVGTKYMLSLLNKLSSGKAKMEDLQELEKISLQVKKGSLCGLGKSAPNPVLTTLKYFRDEYEAHISGICPAKKCKDLIQYEISTICIGCTKCAQNCPAEAIDFAPYEKHFIKQELCIKCDICLQVCPTGAVSKQNIKHD